MAPIRNCLKLGGFPMHVGFLPWDPFIHLRSFCYDVRSYFFERDFMSGSPNSRDSWTDVRDEVACEQLVIDTQLSSPRAEVVDRLTAGNLLEVALDEGRRDVVVVRHRGDLAGGLASPNLGRLRVCLSGGTRYQAEVVEVNGGQIRVRVTAIGA